MIDFEGFPKLPRLFKDILVTEKIDGTNAQIYIDEDGAIRAGSRNRWITPEDDNHGFARWVRNHNDVLLSLGPGRHFGEWWGQGIQRGYGLTEKRFTLFNAGRWTAENVPECVSVVPILYRGSLDFPRLDDIEDDLLDNGSRAAPGYMNPEGYVVYHTAANQVFKVPFNK